MPSSLRLRLIATAAALTLLVPAAPGAQTTERQVYVTVLDNRDGTPVSGLTTEHFAVREGGRDRDVLRVETLDTPMHVAVVLDTSFNAVLPIDSFRTAVGDFVERLAAVHHVALYTVAERPARLLEFTRDTTRLRAAVAGLFARPESRAYLIDTIDLVLGDLTRLEPARPVVVAFTTESVEASNLTAAAVMKQLIARGTSLHAVAFSNAVAVTGGAISRDAGNTSVPGRSQMLGRLNAEGEGDRERNRLLTQGTTLTAGSVQWIVSVTALSAPLHKLASEFAYSYRLTFAGPAPDKPLKDLQIGLLVEGVTVRAIAAPHTAGPVR